MSDIKKRRLKLEISKMKCRLEEMEFSIFEYEDKISGIRKDMEIQQTAITDKEKQLEEF